MDVRNLSDRSDQERFREHVSNNSYYKLLILWGTQPLVELLQWYQYIQYQEGISVIVKCLKDYSEEFYSNFLP